MSANIAIFVPHNGCRNQCSFCNQFSITSQIEQPTAESVRTTVDNALGYLGDDAKDAEIAFFGGSFTAVERSYMTELLEVAYPYVRDKQVRGIRLSTRPDAIDDDVLELLKRYGATTIELGAQSMCDEVLSFNRRGHTAEDVKRASRLIRSYGFSLGLQMMTGLAKADDKKDVETCEELIALNPDFVRIYPTIVLKNTYLAQLYEQGEYQPQSVEDAVDLCCKLLVMFGNAGIPVIRLGLHSIDEESYVAGPWHSAFGELCKSRIFYNKVAEKIDRKGRYNLYVSPRMVSKAVGQNRSNIKRFSSNGIDVTVCSDIKLNDEEFIIEEVKL